MGQLKFINNLHGKSLLQKLTETSAVVIGVNLPFTVQSKDVR